MTVREKRRIAMQLNLNPKIWHMVDAGTDYIRYRNNNTGEIRKFYNGGEMR